MVDRLPSFHSWTEATITRRRLTTYQLQDLILCNVDNYRVFFISLFRKLLSANVTALTSDLIQEFSYCFSDQNSLPAVSQTSYGPKKMGKLPPPMETISEKESPDGSLILNGSMEVVANGGKVGSLLDHTEFNESALNKENSMKSKWEADVSFARPCDRLVFGPVLNLNLVDDLLTHDEPLTTCTQTMHGGVWL